MRVKIKLILLFIFFLSKVSAQTGMDTDGLNNLNNIYLYSLKTYCQQMDSIKTNTIHVRREYFIGDSWPKKINGIQIVYVEDKDYKNLIRENGGKLSILGISPLALRNNVFSVGLIYFYATYKNRKIILGNGGGMSVIFNYYENQKGFSYNSKKFYGI